jgi:hypothetical protein
MESILGKEEALSCQARVTVRKGHNFWSNSWIAIKFLLEFSETIFHGVDVESILGKAEVLSLQARVMIRKGHNFWSKRSIAIKFL